MPRREWLLWVLCSLATIVICEEVTLRTRLNTAQIYRSANIPPSQLYAISVDRLSSSAETEPSRCRAVPKHIEIAKQTQIFRLSQAPSADRSAQVYEKLTKLNEQENIIEEFEVVGGRLFLITTQGDGYFLPLDPTDKTPARKVTTKFFQEAMEGQFMDVIAIMDYKDRALLVGRRRAVLCKFENDECDIVQGYEQAESFRGAQLFQDNGRFYLIVIQANELTVYELAANSHIKNKRVLDAKFLGADKVSLRGVLRDGTKLLVLDDLVGLREVIGENGLEVLKNGSRVVVEQFGCYQAVGQDGVQSLALACAPSLRSYFILKLVKSHQFAQPIFQPLQTVFLHEKLYQIDYTQNLLLSRVFSGVKLHWSSKKQGSPYPHFYRQAGDVFLHNAIQAKLKTVNGVKSIILSAEDELLSYQMRTVEPYVECSSGSEVREEYKLVYSFPCEREDSFMHQQNVCWKEENLFFEAWQHKQLGMSTHIVPFLLSLIGVVVVSYAVATIYRKYTAEVERAKIKYNIQEQEMEEAQA